MLKKFAVILILLLFPVLTVYSWGFWGHRHINKYAVFTLPLEMIRFYKSHYYYIEEHAVDADKRRYVNPEEGARHFIDLEYYTLQSGDSIPQQFYKAEKKYGKDTLQKYGMNPWYIQLTYTYLVKAFKERDSAKILKYSADIGHYIADACVPLHTTWNYNGQLTGQTGIHAFWESAIPELLGDEFEYFTERAYYIPDISSFVWKLINDSHMNIDTVLSLEKKLSSTMPQNDKYTFKERNSKIIRTYSDRYIKEYNRLLNGMVEKKMRTSIISIGSVWMSAWIDAGQPNLRDFSKSSLETEQNLQVPISSPMIGRPEE